MAWPLRALIVPAFVGACAAPDRGPVVITPEMALALAMNGAVLVDVRLPEERIDRREPPHTAAWFPFDRYAPRQFSSAVSEAVDGHRSRPIVLICEVGLRSAWAARVLADAGFTDVMSVDQGYRLWRDQALALVDGREIPTPDLSLD